MSPPPRPEQRAAVALAVVLAFVAGACVRPGPPDVAIRPVQANLVFGVKPQPETARPPVQEVATEIAAAPPSLDHVSFELPPPLAPLFTEPPAQAADCEPAPPTAAARVPVDVNITGDVPVGLFRWKVEGSVTPAGGEPAVLRRRFESRIVRNVQRLREGEYRYETVQPLPGSDLVAVSTIKVRTSALQVNRDPGYNYLVTVPTVGEPDRGVVLERIDYKDRSGVTKRSFSPATGILLLPLPVTAGESYRSVAVDPKTGQTIVHEAQVLRRGRVDACGELADGWYVTATQTTSGAEEGVPAEIAYDYIVAPQFGGILLNEHVKATASDGDVVELDYTIGQLNPGPLPAGA